MQTAIGISPSNREGVVQQLTHLLADEFVLYTKTLNAHWNVEGRDFYNKHLFFEGQYQQLALINDDVAERIRSMGHYAPATLKSFLSLTHLSETNASGNSSTAFMQNLLEDHTAIIEFIRGLVKEFADHFKDAGSSDFITGIAEKHEKMAWMLRAHLS
ncbi:MAG: DNA starvation/stationary phase protection protein [Chitinophagaceae bacterium]